MSKELKPVEITTGENHQKDQLNNSNWKRNWYIIPFIILLLGIGYNYVLTLIAWYIQKSYIPDHILDHYIQNPLQDVSLNIPVRYDAPFNFVDLAEAVDIQAAARFQNEFNTLMDVTIELIKSDENDYHKNLYPESEMFINCKLSDINALQVDGFNNYGELYFMLETVNQNDLPFLLTQIVIDHCFKNEVEKYSPDSFYKIKNKNDDDYYLVHEDELNLPIITKLINKNYTEQYELVLHYHVIFEDLLDFDIKSAILEHTIKLLNNVPNLFRLSIHVDHITTEDTDNIEDNDEYDKTLSQLSILPVVRNIFTNAALEKNSDKQHVHFVFYPVVPNDDTFDKLAGSGLTMDFNGSNFFSVGDWGAVYFSLLDEPESDGRYKISDDVIESAFWRFDETLLDSIGVPDERLSPKTRMEAFKRSMTIQYLTKFSGLLFNLKTKLKKDNISPQTMKRLAELFTESLILREEVLEALRDKQTFKALVTSEKMLDKIKIALNQ